MSAAATGASRGKRATPRGDPGAPGSGRHDFAPSGGEDEEMTKSELIERIARKQPQLVYRDVETAVKSILEHMAEHLATSGRIEIRGFGSFSLHYRPERVGRNPKTGAGVSLPAKYVPHFKPGKELRERVNRAYRPPSGEISHPDVAPAPALAGSAADGDA